MTEPKRVVLWGTGVVGSMVLAEILDHPVFELVGVGVSNPAKVGQVLATMRMQTPLGEVQMREDNHQLLQPMFLSVLDTEQKFVFPESKLGFRTVSRIEPEAQRLPTTCKFQPPA